MDNQVVGVGHHKDQPAQPEELGRRADSQTTRPRITPLTLALWQSRDYIARGELHCLHHVTAAIRYARTRLAGLAGWMHDDGCSLQLRLSSLYTHDHLLPRGAQLPPSSDTSRFFTFHELDSHFYSSPTVQSLCSTKTPTASRHRATGKLSPLRSTRDRRRNSKDGARAAWLRGATMAETWAAWATWEAWATCLAEESAA